MAATIIIWMQTLCLLLLRVLVCKFIQLLTDYHQILQGINLWQSSLWFLGWDKLWICIILCKYFVMRSRNSGKMCPAPQSVWVSGVCGEIMSLVGYYNTGLARGVGRVSQDNAKVQKHCWHQTPKYFFVWILEIIFFSASLLCVRISNVAWQLLIWEGH